VAARPVISGAGVPELLARLEDRACHQPGAGETVELRAPGTCGP
jgi:hypothetical protein